MDISSYKCVHMCVDIKHVNINAWEHAIIQAYKDDSMVSSKHVIMEACEHGIM